MRDNPKRITLLVMDERETKTMEVSAWQLYAVRPMLTTLCGALALAIGTCAYLGYSWYQAQMRADDYANHNEVLAQQLVDLKNATSDEIENTIIELSYSEKTLNQLYLYLKNRGVNVKPITTAQRRDTQSGANDAAGGPEIPLLLSDEEYPYTGNFAKEVEDLLNKIKGIPLGRPSGGGLSSRFGTRSNPFTGKGKEMHLGLDFRGRIGDAVRVTASGEVTYAGAASGYGNLIKISHSNGYETRYAHLSAILVKKGQKVQAGDTIGKIGSTGRSTGPHLHYEVRLNGRAIDPEGFLSLQSKVAGL